MTRARPRTGRLVDLGRCPQLASTAIAVAAALASCTPETESGAETPDVVYEDPAGLQMDVGPRQAGIEYIAHACFRIHSPAGNRVIIDPYANRVWIGYDFPEGLETDAVLISHPHYDHDAGQRVGHDFPWDNEVPVLREPGTKSIGDIRITGIEGKHADPYGKEFGQTNTIWLLEVGGIRIVHIGDNGPLTDQNIAELGRVDVLMLPIDGDNHILAEEEIEAIRAALRPKALIPMHYKHQDLEPEADRPRDLGTIEEWLVGKNDVNRVSSNQLLLDTDDLPAGLVVLRHSPLVEPPG
jgi:L-ascorbate metabolism protein UlaG (beta-lactamase superfamily)